MLILLVFNTGCSDTTNFQGIVKDAVSGNPVVDAYVLVRFIGDGAYVWPDPGATARNRCYGSRVVQTDDQGRFNIGETKSDLPSTDKYTHNKKIEITIYKMGYTMGSLYDEKSHDKRSYPLFFARFETVNGPEISIDLKPTSESEKYNRYYYINDVINKICSDYTLGHWKMMKSMLDDISTWGNSIDHWKTAGEICRKMNEKNKQEKLGQSIVNCSIYDNDLLQSKKKFYDGLAAIVEDIDWGSGLKMKLLTDLSVATNVNSNDFVITNPTQETKPKEILAALKKICASSYPRNLAKGVICIYFGAPPEDWQMLGVESCNAHYQMYEYKLKVRKSNAPEESLDLGPDWCR